MRGCFTRGKARRKEPHLKSFSELSLKPELAQAITDLGYTEPTPIQAETLPILLGEPTDFMGLAATGTGKTAAFSIPMLEKIDASKKKVQALILCPTRELAIQVAGQITLLGKKMGVKALPVYGGAGYGDQIYGLKHGANVVVGTPGRVIDHLEKGTLNLDHVKLLILDEADEMISMGFKDDIETVLTQIDADASNIWLFSATMSKEVRKIADQYLRDPGLVQVNRTEMLPEQLEQIYYATSESNKPEVLCKLIDAADDFYGLIFCQTKALVVDLTSYLTGRGYRVDCLHGDKDQNARERSMQAFRDRKVTILICTDVACRGLDVKDVTHVINYSIPRELDNYVHRIGRTARSGKKGFAFSLVTPSHRGLVRRIEAMTKSQMVEGKIPTRKEIGAKKVSKILEKLLADENYAKAMDLMNEEFRSAIREMSTDEIAARFLSLSFPEVFAGREEIEESQKKAKGTGSGTIILSGARRDGASSEVRAPRERREGGFGGGYKRDGFKRDGFKDGFKKEGGFGGKFGGGGFKGARRDFAKPRFEDRGGESPAFGVITPASEATPAPRKEYDRPASRFGAYPKRDRKTSKAPWGAKERRFER